MRHGVALFTSDHGATPADTAKAAEDAGFDTFYVPEHTHIPVRRDAAHPRTGDATLPDDRYRRTLDPWVSLATASMVTSRIRLGTGVALPVESDPITLAKTIATLDHLSGGRVLIGAGFGWNTDELTDHGVPAGRRRTVLREYVEAMRALWTQDEASYHGEYVDFGASWAFPKPTQAHIPLVIGAGGGPKTLAWIAAHADGWMTTPVETDVVEKTAALREAWSAAGRSGAPEIHVHASGQPDPALLDQWEGAGATEVVWGSLPLMEPDTVAEQLSGLAAAIGIERDGTPT